MQRLLVNPGTPQVWEIPLKPGTNRIGRVEDNDFTIPHASVSSHHCEVIVTDDGVFLRDLGSTNGSFLNRKRVTETLLQHGQHLQFGSVDLLFESGNAATPKMQAVVSLLGEDAAALIPPPPKPAIKAPCRTELGQTGPH